MQILLDAGVLLRAFDQASPHHATVMRAIRILRSQRHELVTTGQNIGEFWNVSTRPAQSRGGYGLPVPVVERRVQWVERLCAVLAFTDRAYREWRQIVVAQQVIGVGVHDARIVATMITANITHLLTLNDADFRRYVQLVVWTPDDVLRSVASADP